MFLGPQSNTSSQKPIHTFATVCFFQSKALTYNNTKCNCYIAMQYFHKISLVFPISWFTNGHYIFISFLLVVFMRQCSQVQHKAT